MADPTCPRQDPVEIDIQAAGPPALGLTDEEDTLLHRVWLAWCQAVSETSWAPQPLSTVKICNLFRAQGSEAPGVTSSLAE